MLIFSCLALKSMVGRYHQPYLLQGSLDVDPLAPGHSRVSQTVPSIPPAGYINPLPPQALEGLSHYLHTIIGKSRSVLGKEGREGGVREREDRGVEWGGVHWVGGDEFPVE